MTPWCASTSGTSSLEEHGADGGEIALALQHAGEPCQVRLEPVLLGVAVGRQPQVVDHRVDVVFELGHLAAGLDLDRPRQVALGHGGRDFGDRAHLVGEIGRRAGSRCRSGPSTCPAAPGTLACPPSRPSTPTSRATVVTWSAKMASVPVMLLMVSASAATSPLDFTVRFCVEIAVGHRGRRP